MRTLVQHVTHEENVSFDCLYLHFPDYRDATKESGQLIYFSICVLLTMFMLKYYRIRPHRSRAQGESGSNRSQGSA